MNRAASLFQYFAAVYCASILVIAGSASNNSPAFAAPSVKDTNLRIDTVATGLSQPTSMAFLGLNDLLVLEKNTGLVKRIKNNVVLPAALLDLSVATNSERGLLGIDIKRRGSSTTQFDVYLYYTAASNDGGSAIANRLSKYILTIDPRLGPAQGRMFQVGTLLNLPATPGGPNHDGGKVAIGPDSNVYTVIGDLNRRTQAQNVETGPAADGTGGIMRVTQDGSTVGSGILGSTSPLNKYFAYGVRNSFGLDFDPLTGKLWDTENGAGSADEINLADPGFNSGWVDIMGFAPSGFNFNNLVNFGGKGKYSDPEFVWGETVAPTAVKFLTSNKLGSTYQNDMFVGDFNKGRIYDFNLNSGRNALALSGVMADKVASPDLETAQVVFGQGFGGITDLKVGIGDGYLYVLSIGSGAVYKIVPKTAASSSSEVMSVGSEQDPFADSEESKITKKGKRLEIEKREQEIKVQAQNLLEKQQREQQGEQQEQVQEESNAVKQLDLQNELYDDRTDTFNQTTSMQSTLE